MPVRLRAKDYKKRQHPLGPNMMLLFTKSGCLFCPRMGALLDGRTAVVASHVFMLWGLLASLLPLTLGPSSAPFALLPGNSIVCEIPNTL